MKVELKIGDTSSKEKHLRLLPQSTEEREEATIDIAMVLAANQAILKNISLKMDAMENRLLEMETQSRRQLRLLKGNQVQRQFLLEEPKVVQPWTPEYPELSQGYFSGFSFFDRLLHPERMRRQGAE